MVNNAIIRELRSRISNMDEEEQSAVAMELSSYVLVKELYERLTFAESKNTDIFAIATKERLYGKAIKEADSARERTIDILTSKLVGVGEGS